MTTTREPEFVAETLAWCNERRAENGEEPLARLPKGGRMDPRSCPCGSATGLFVGPTNYWTQGARSVGLPEPVLKFVQTFDRGELPQYDVTVAA